MGRAAPARNRVLSGAADFAISSFDEQKDMVAAKQPVVAVMAVFQIPPTVIFALADSGIKEPKDLIGKRVGVTTDYWRGILRQTLTSAGVDPAKVVEMEAKTDQLQLLYAKVVDAWLGYAQDEPIQAQLDGHQVTTIYPADYGVGGYEGLLLVNSATLQNRPDLVRRFLAATYDGWRYAVEHPDEAAAILAKWAPDNGLEFQKLAVRAVTPLVDVPQFPFGWIDEAHWRQLMGNAFDPANPGYTMQHSPMAP